MEIQPPENATISYKQFYAESKSSLGLLTFIIDSVITIDFASAVAKQALEGPENLEIKTPGELAKLAPGPRTKHIRENSRCFSSCFYRG